MSNPQDISKRAEDLRDYTAEILSGMVQKKSLSAEEKEAADFVADAMRDAQFDEVKIDEIGNVIGRIGNGSKILAIDGHIDTVGMGNLDNWHFNPLGGEIKNGYVHGRGSVDQKGGVASFIAAGKMLKELGLDNDITVYFTATVMEEDCDGLCWKYMVEENKIKPDCVIVTEPTNLNVYRGHRGRMEMDAHYYGISSHGSAPERGENAIYKASKAVLEIEKLNENLKIDELLGKGTIAVTQIESESPSLCAVPDYCKFHLDRRLTWGEDKELAVEQIEELSGNGKFKVDIPYYDGTAYTGKKYGMDKYFPTWKLEEDHEMIQKGVSTFTELFDKKPLVDKWTFSTNGVTINGMYDIPIVGFGPGNEVLAHAPNEKVEIEHLVKAAAFYAHFCRTF